MEINIQIKCDDDLSALKSHLSVVRDQLIKAYQKQSGNIKLEDETYLGSYSFTVIRNNS